MARIDRRLRTLLADDDFHAEGTERCVEWVKQNKGRRLGIPKVIWNRPSVTEWLTQSRHNFEVQRTKPKRGAKPIVPTAPSPPQTSGLTMAAGRSTLSAESATEEALELPTSASTALQPPKTPPRPISQELSRRRQLHPRMRWPRLASRESPHEASCECLFSNMTSREGLFSNSSQKSNMSIGLGETSRSNMSSTGIIIGYDEMLEEKEENSEFEDFLRGEMDTFSEGIVIGGASIGFDELEGQFSWPWSPGNKLKSSNPSPSSSRGRQHPKPEPVHIHSRISMMTSATDLSLPDSHFSLSSSSSSILPRLQVHDKPVSGGIATVHAPEAQHLIESRLHTAQTQNMDMRRAGLATAARGAASLLGQDDKWYLRQAPMSSIMAKKSGPNSSSSASKSEGEKSQGGNRRGAARGGGGAGGGEGGGGAENANKAFNFENWGLDDTYICSLCNAATKTDFARIRRLNLADNRLTEHSVTALTGIGDSFSALKSINLAGNQLGPAGGFAVAKFLTTARPRLAELDLSGNLIGDRAVAELCEGLTHFNHNLKVLGLACNLLGQSDAGGIALGQLLQERQELQTLDLHWNSLHGIGATCFLAGLYENNITIGGQLRRLNLAWNRLGLRCKDSQRNSGTHGSATCSCTVCLPTSRTAKMLSSIFSDGKVLFHLDISYNGFCANMCEILATGLRRNHTLFGIHMIGNEAWIDDQGFIIPNSGPSAKVQDAERLGITTNRMVRNVPAMVLKKFGGNSALSGANGGLGGAAMEALETTSWGSLNRNVQKCWICENWIEYTVSYVVGFSGNEESVDEVTSVAVYFNLDGWSAPTVLTRNEEVFQRRFFEGKVATRHLARTQAGIRMSKAASRCSTKDCIPKTPEGKIVRWTGSRVLPPSTEPIEVVFHVNDKAKVSHDLPTRKLDRPKLIVTSRHPTRLAKSGGVAEDDHTAAALEVNEVNVLHVAVSTLERFEQGAAVALCVLEDPAHRGDVSVYPRHAIDEVITKRAPRWEFESSSFKDYIRDNDQTIYQCFEFDWKMSKLPQMMKDPMHQDMLCSFLSKRYKQVMLAYHYFAFTQFVDPTYAVFLGMTGVKDIMMRYDKKPGIKDQRKSWLFDGKSLLTTDVDNIYVAANVVTFDNEEDRRKLKALPARGLARFQFLEAFVRIVCLRLHESGEKDSPASAMQEFLKMTKFGEDIMELRKSLHFGLFTEECCLVFREHQPMLEALFDSYMRRTCYPGRPKKGITYGSWLEMMQDAEAYEGGCGIREFSRAFAIGKEIRVDEITTFRHMELTWPEFLVTLGALVRLRNDFEPDFFCDMLNDFITDFMSDLYNKDVARGNVDTTKYKISQDPSLTPVISLVARLFEDADEDNSGTLTVREFKRCLNQPEVIDQIHELGIEVGEFNVLFRSLDSDHSGEVTLDEFCEGFIKMKIAMRGMSRAIAYFRRVIAEKDVDGSGSLNLAEFMSLCSEPSIQKKMQALGIEIDEIETLFEEIISDKCHEESGAINKEDQEIDADHVISAFVRLRDPSLGGKRAMNFLRQMFIEADADNSGTLTRSEVKATFLTDRVSNKLDKLGLKVPDWLGIFDELDFNYDGTLSWDELHQGVSTLWEAELQKQVSNEVEKKVEVAMSSRKITRPNSALRL